MAMTDRKIIEKMYRLLDQEMSASEEEAFVWYLDQHPDKQALINGLKALHHQMQNPEERRQETIDVTKEVLLRIDRAKYTPAVKKPEIRFQQVFWSGSVFRVGLAFTLGVFAGLLIFTFLTMDFSGKSFNPEKIKGTLYDSRSFGNMKPAGILQFESPAARVWCDIRYSAKTVEIRLDVSSPSPVKVAIEFDFSSFQVLYAQNFTANDQTTIMAAQNFIRIDNTGQSQIIIRLQNKNSLPQDIVFKIMHHDSPVYQNVVQVNKE